MIPFGCRRGPKPRWFDSIREPLDLATRASGICPPSNANRRHKGPYVLRLHARCVRGHDPSIEFDESPLVKFATGKQRNLSHHLDAVDVFDWLWMIWFVIAQWLGGRWWRTVNLPVSGIYQEAKRGSLRLSGMALMIERAAFVFFGAMVVSWLIMHHWL